MASGVDWTHLPHDALVAILTAAAGAGPFTFCSAAATCRTFWAISVTDVKGLSVDAYLGSSSAGTASLAAWLRRYAHHVEELRVSGATATLLPLVEQLAATGVTSSPLPPLCPPAAAQLSPPSPPPPAAAAGAGAGGACVKVTPIAAAAMVGEASDHGHAAAGMYNQPLPLEELVLGGGLSSPPGHTTHLLRHLPNLRSLVLQEDWGGGLPQGLAGATGLTRFDWTVSSKESYSFANWSLDRDTTDTNANSSSGTRHLPASLRRLCWRSHHPHVVISQLLVNITHLTALTRLELAHSCGGLYDAAPLLALPALKELELRCSPLQPPSDTLLLQLAPRLVGLQLQGGACRALGCLTALTVLTALGVAEEYLQGALPRLVALRRLVLSPRKLYLLSRASVWSDGNWFGAPVAAAAGAIVAATQPPTTSAAAAAAAADGEGGVQASQHHCQAGRLLSSCAGLRDLAQLHLLLGPCCVTPSAALALVGLQQVTSLELSQHCASTNTSSSRRSSGTVHGSITTSSSGGGSSSIWQPWAAAVCGLSSLKHLSLPLHWVTSSNDWLGCLSDARVIQVSLKCDAHTTVQEALLAVERLQQACSLSPRQQQQQRQQLHVVLEGVPPGSSNAVKHALAAWTAQVGDGSFTWQVCV